MAGHHRVHMAVPLAMEMIMSAMSDATIGGDDRLCDPDEMVYTVASGLSLLEDQTPRSWKEAMASPDASKWKAAMDKEFNGCEEMVTWVLVPRSSVPKWQIIVPCKWVFKYKVNANGEIESYKARLTPKGFLQREGINFFETFAATGKYKSMRLGLALTAAFDHELDQMDVPQAFLNADVEEEVYMELPEGYREGRENMVCRLKKSLYGLKQAPRNWYLLISKFVAEQLGYKATVSDPCLFFKRSHSGRLMLLFLFVDDFQSSYHSEDKAEWNELKAKLVDRFKTKDLGASTWILGMRISRDRKARTVTLDQELYVSKALERYGLEQCKPVATPGVVGSSLADATDGGSEADSQAPADKQLFQEMVGTLMYSAVSCRPDIAHAVQVLARSMQAPTQQHLQAAKRVFRYLAGTKSVGLIFGSRNGDTVADSRGRDNSLRLDVCCFADADWANDKADRKSITGWVAKVNGDPISWASKKQRTVAQSTCEAELYAEAAAIQEVLWLRGLLKELGLHVQTGSRLRGQSVDDRHFAQRHQGRAHQARRRQVPLHHGDGGVGRGAAQVAPDLGAAGGHLYQGSSSAGFRALQEDAHDALGVLPACWQGETMCNISLVSPAKALLPRSAGSAGSAPFGVNASHLVKAVPLRGSSAFSARPFQPLGTPAGFRDKESSGREPRTGREPLGREPTCRRGHLSMFGKGNQEFRQQCSNLQDRGVPRSRNNATPQRSGKGEPTGKGNHFGTRTVFPRRHRSQPPCSRHSTAISSTSSPGDFERGDNPGPGTHGTLPSGILDSPARWEDSLGVCGEVGDSTQGLPPRAVVKQRPLELVKDMQRRRIELRTYRLALMRATIRPLGSGLNITPKSCLFNVGTLVQHFWGVPQRLRGVSKSISRPSKTQNSEARFLGSWEEGERPRPTLVSKFSIKDASKTFSRGCFLTLPKCPGCPLEVRKHAGDAFTACTSSCTSVRFRGGVEISSHRVHRRPSSGRPLFHREHAHARFGSTVG